jgi:hypothetical protein
MRLNSGLLRVSFEQPDLDRRREDRNMDVRDKQSMLERTLIVGAPLLLAVIELFHPRPHDLLRLDVKKWLVVHFAQIAFFPLSALAMAWLIRSRTGTAATVSRVALFIFAVGWTAWDSVAGVATGILLRAAHASGSPETWRAAIDAVWLNPIMGGAPAPLFAIIGAVALSLGAVSAAITLKRAGHSWAPLVLLGISSFGITVFKTHAWPGGPLTFGGIAIASAWLIWEQSQQRVSGKAQTQSTL